jgi:hypothetical protein
LSENDQVKSENGRAFYPIVQAFYLIILTFNPIDEAQNPIVLTLNLINEAFYLIVLTLNLIFPTFYPIFLTFYLIDGTSSAINEVKSENFCAPVQLNYPVPNIAT